MRSDLISGRLRQITQAAGSRANEWSMRNALYRSSSLDIRGVIDVGASNGSWSRLARAVWPSAQFLLIEAQPIHEPGLRKSGFPYVLAAAGDGLGTAHFDASDPWGGVASHESTGPADIIVPMTTVDVEVRRTELPAPYLLKLDTHGFEREILDGAITTVERASLLVIEAYNFELRPRSYRFEELISELDGRGFRCLDLADPMHRKRDGALWQMDLFFARKELPVFNSNAYE